MKMNQTPKLAKTNPYRWIAVTGQCFALLPVDGVKSNNIRFHWKSVHIFYNLFITLVLCILLVFETIYASTQILSQNRLNTILTKIYGILMLLAHLRLGHKWPNLMQNWFQTEHIMNIRYGCLKSFGLRVKVCLILFFAISTVGWMKDIMYQYMHGDVLMIDFYAFIFNYVPFNSIFGIILAFVYTVQFFMVDFNDFFIIVTSMYVALRFQQIHKQLEMHETHRVARIANFWQEMRRDYDRLSNLCMEMDDGINCLILLSFFYNMYLLISYLFYHLMLEKVLYIRFKLLLISRVDSPEAEILFYIFFPLLVVKVLAVCLYTSWINDESLAPVNILNSMPSRDYNTEIGRWLTQMSFDKVALTGGKIFKITRSIFLSVISIVVTYELVVMQFHGFSSKV